VRALLLAAGEGTRLQPLTLDRPKAMVEIAGRPAIAYALEWLREGGVGEVAVNLFHHPEVLRSFVGDGSAFGLRVTYSVEGPEILGTAGALRPLFGFFSGEPLFVVVYGDVLTNVSLAEVTARHGALGADVTIVVNRGYDPTVSGVVGFGLDGLITGFVEKPPRDQVRSEWVNAGIYVCGPRVLDFVVPGGYQDFGRDVFPAMLDSGCRLAAYPTEAVILEFGTPDRIAVADAAVRAGALARVPAGQG